MHFPCLFYIGEGRCVFFNEFLLKLSDFTESNTFDEYKLGKSISDQPSIVKDNELQHREEKLVLPTVVSDDEIIKKDWEFFAQFLSNIMEEAKFKSKPEFHALPNLLKRFKRIPRHSKKVHWILLKSSFL